MLPITWIIHLLDMIQEEDTTRVENFKLNNAAFVVFIGLVS